jgi:hypothetical protein
MSKASDFDFFIGSWSVLHRRLTERLAECTEWEEFHGTTVTRKILGGMGNCDDNALELPGGLRFPRQPGHPFHGKPITHSTANRPPSPAQTGQQFRFKLDSLKRPERA